MPQAPHGQQPVYIQSPPPPQQAMPMQQSSIHIPVGPPSTKVVSTATIVPTAYPTAPGNNIPISLLMSPKTCLNTMIYINNKLLAINKNIP